MCYHTYTPKAKTYSSIWRNSTQSNLLLDIRVRCVITLYLIVLLLCLYSINLANTWWFFERFSYFIVNIWTRIFNVDVQGLFFYTAYRVTSHLNFRVQGQIKSGIIFTRMIISRFVCRVILIGGESTISVLSSNTSRGHCIHCCPNTLWTGLTHLYHFQLRVNNRIDMDLVLYQNVFGMRVSTRLERKPSGVLTW